MFIETKTEKRKISMDDAKSTSRKINILSILAIY